VDLSKSYDKVRWFYLRLMLIHVGFNLNFVNWVMNCVSLVSFAVLINGSTSEFFRIGRGLRHGCPISPLLFLVFEGLSRALSEEKYSRYFKGVRVGRTLYVSHLLFVDGMLLFCDGTQRYGKKLREIMDIYCKVTDMVINMGKYIISFMGVSEEEKVQFM
jgi:hypothetical protein